MCACERVSEDGDVISGHRMVPLSSKINARWAAKRLLFKYTTRTSTLLTLLPQGSLQYLRTWHLIFLLDYYAAGGSKGKCTYFPLQDVGIQMQIAARSLPPHNGRERERERERERRKRTFFANSVDEREREILHWCYERVQTRNVQIE